MMKKSNIMNVYFLKKYSSISYTMNENILSIISFQKKSQEENKWDKQDTNKQNKNKSKRKTRWGYTTINQNICAYVCICMGWRGGQQHISLWRSQSWPQSCSTLDLRQGLSRYLEITAWLHWLASESRRSSCVPSQFWLPSD